jgi:PAS domain-containing protein
LRVAREIGDLVISSVREAILLLGPNLRVQRANQAFCEIFQSARAEVEGQFFYDLVNRQWDIDDLRRMLENVLPEKRNFEGYAVKYSSPSALEKNLLLRGHRIESERSGGGVILLVITEANANGR